MTARTQIQIRVEPYRAAAYQGAADRCGLSRHAWMVATLDAAAGSTARPRGRQRRRSHEAEGGAVQLTVKASRDQAELWSAAAARAGLDRCGWCRLVLDAAAGFDALGVMLWGG